MQDIKSTYKKIVAFLYTNSKQSEKEINKIIPFTVASKEIKYLGIRASLMAQTVESVCNVGEPGLIPGLERSPGGGSGTPFQYSCLENPMDRGGWWSRVHGVTNSWT